MFDGLGEALATIDGLRVYTYPADSIEPPAAVIAFPETPLAADFGGGMEVEFPVWVAVSKASARTARVALCDYVPTVKAAIEADKTLGGACNSVAVTTAEFTVFTNAGTEHWAVRFTVSVVD